MTNDTSDYIVGTNYPIKTISDKNYDQCVGAYCAH